MTCISEGPGLLEWYSGLSHFLSSKNKFNVAEERVWLKFRV